MEDYQKKLNNTSDGAHKAAREEQVL